MQTRDENAASREIQAQIPLAQQLGRIMPGEAQAPRAGNSDHELFPAPQRAGNLNKRKNPAVIEYSNARLYTVLHIRKHSAGKQLRVLVAVVFRQ